jgi:hypothetical protein
MFRQLPVSANKKGPHDSQDRELDAIEHKHSSKPQTEQSSIDEQKSLDKSLLEEVSQFYYLFKSKMHDTGGRWVYGSSVTELTSLLSNHHKKYKSLLLKGANPLDEKGRYITVRAKCDFSIADIENFNVCYYSINSPNSSCYCFECIELTKDLMHQGRLMSLPTKDSLDRNLPKEIMKVINQWSFGREWKEGGNLYQNVFAMLKISSWHIFNKSVDVNLSEKILIRLEKLKEGSDQEILQFLVLEKNLTAEGEISRRLSYCITKLKSLGITLPKEEPVDKIALSVSSSRKLS